MVFEASCDTEDWSNDGKNVALRTGINYNLKCYNRKVILNCKNNSQYYCFYSIFNQINATLILL